ncbi:run domain beclin-1 interacting and cysteine-rich containing protein-like [Plakobranchus ocellatus]|uniref:Run domain beclin-1 interacting and cysteine-rich containing protein-like n=1 Tax=Plakobranchus ocellatus TaxID=259542 RepID=A0AAV3YQ48_9GAST|nr:run domain beclin-1 interacting and cysteine-rich containing protein-like [Plakobranchus ocellatus]
MWFYFSEHQHMNGAADRQGPCCLRDYCTDKSLSQRKMTQAQLSPESPDSGDSTLRNSQTSEDDTVMEEMLATSGPAQQTATVGSVDVSS